LRHKQFVSPTLLETAREFLGSEKSYRQAVQHQGMSLVYDDRQENPLANRGAALAHSTLWHWVSWLGGLTRTRQAAMQLISQKDPGHGLHREKILIDPRKHRSDARHQTLEQAGWLLLVEAVFQQRMEKRIFPRFATGCGWR
jgi:hypothetical protein